MPRRRSDELMAEADRLVAQAKEQRARERKLERQADDHRCRLLGRAVTRIIRTDANLRARMKITMHGYCKGDRDREVFSLDQPNTWFETLTAPTATHATRSPSDSDGGGHHAPTAPAEPSAPQAPHGNGLARLSPPTETGSRSPLSRPNTFRPEDP